MIADISGYTRFMLDSKTCLVHAQMIISQIMKSIIERVEMPLEITKIEGDAIFLYALNQNEDGVLENTKIRDSLITFFNAFYEKIEGIKQSNTCSCGSCKNVNSLRLKIIVHSGEVLFYKLGKFDELSGVNVIIVHRLLKNSVNRDEYILLTENARNDIKFPETMTLEEGKEEYDHLGTIKTFVWFPSLKK